MILRLTACYFASLHYNAAKSLCKHYNAYPEVNLEVHPMGARETPQKRRPTAAADEAFLHALGERVRDGMLNFGRMLRGAIYQHSAVFLRDRGRDLTFRLRRSRYELKSVEGRMLEDGIGYVKIRVFAATTDQLLG